MTIGEIYFIRERDRMDGQHSTYVKIGLVKSIERNSEERLSDHQTGNPRDLVLHHVVQTPSPYWVERGLHHRLGRKRVRGEWFLLELDELDESIQLAEQLAGEAFEVMDLIAEADRLKDTLSNGAILPSTDEPYEWLDQLSRAHARVRACEELSKEYGEVFRALTPEQREAVEDEELVVIEPYIHRHFDREGFALSHPEIFARFISIEATISGSFRPKYIDHSVPELDRDLAQFDSEFRNACKQVLDEVMSFSDLAEIFRDLESRQNAYEWEKKIADAKLRVLCGEADGIDGLCTWKRVTKEKEVFDEDGLQSAHPEEYKPFLTVEARQRQKTKKRPRRKIAP